MTRLSLADAVGRPEPRVLVIDNRDSFVFNLVEEFRSRGAEVLTIRSNIGLERLEAQLESFRPHLVLLSPGPGRPEEAGVMVPWLGTRPAVPVLGICLGHQALAVAAGGRLRRAPRPVHGRASRIYLREDPLFRDLPSPVVAARYHSLVVSELPDDFDVIATARDAGGDLIMAMRHRRLCQVGLQFHPESVLTPQGSRILEKFLEEALSQAEQGGQAS